MDSQVCKKILIVEDDKDIREALADFLKIEGFKAYQAENGRDALDKLKKIGVPCMIVLDLMMPIMSGWEFAEKIESDPELHYIPIVVLSASIADERHLNVKRRLTKPVEINTLMREVRSCCC